MNAFGAVFADRALAEADRVDERRARGDREPLLGVPVAVKDEIDIAGEVTSRGTGAITARATALARPGALVSDGMVRRLLTAEGRIGDRLGRLFADHDVLMTPVMSQPAVPAGIMEGRGATATYLWETGWVPFKFCGTRPGSPRCPSRPGTRLPACRWPCS
jgi:Asp-tRNA(Asn)/Glu-tRNA(Gln) amidotransferase A subunit family amidase